MKAELLPILIIVIQTTSAASPLQVLYSFNVPRYIAGGTGQYIGRNIAILDVDYWKDPGSIREKIFVTTPRGRPGTPASLSIVTNGTNNQPVLSPYPSWAANQPTCENIVCAFRTQVDSCNRLWVIDTGLLNAFTANAQQICPPKILIFDLLTDTLISRHEYPEAMVNSAGLITTIVADVRRNRCNESFAYMADPVAFQLNVFSLRERRYWFFRNRLLYPYPLDGIYKINNVTFDLMDGVLGLALGPEVQNNRTLYLHSLASRRESYVQTSVLQNPNLGGEDSATAQQFMVSPGSRTSQSAVEAVWDGGLYFNLLGENTLACWPTNTPYTRGNIVRLLKDEEKIQFVSGMKAISGYLWLLSSTLQTYITNTTNENIINYRIIKVSIDQLTRGRGCHNYAH